MNLISIKLFREIILYEYEHGEAVTCSLLKFLYTFNSIMQFPEIYGLYEHEHGETVTCLCFTFLF